MQPTFLINHGGGPCFFFPGATWVAAGAVSGGSGTIHFHGHTPSKPMSGFRSG